MDVNNYDCTNIDTYTGIHPIIVAVLALTHMAKDCFEDVIFRILFISRTNL